MVGEGQQRRAALTAVGLSVSASRITTAIQQINYKNTSRSGAQATRFAVRA
jgi:hypothetical protein